MWHQADLNRFAAADAEGINSLISLIGSIYAVVFAFVIFVIWGQFTAVEEATQKECTFLNDLLRFAPVSRSRCKPRHPTRLALEYTRKVAISEWRSLGERHKDKPAEQAFAVLINTVSSHHAGQSRRAGLSPAFNHDIARKP